MKDKRGRGTAQDDKPLVLGLLQRNRLAIIEMSDNFQRKTIEPIIGKNVKENSTIYTEKYNIYNWLSTSYSHKAVNHVQREYARDEDGDGKCEVHVNTIESFWSLLRPWLRRGTQTSSWYFTRKVPSLFRFFEFLYNIRKRGKITLPALVQLLIAT